MRKKNKTVEPSKAPWVIDYRGKQEAIIKDAEGRLAAACEQTVTNCNQLGNAAAMRKALVQVSRIAVEMTRKTITGEPEDRKTVDRWALRLCDIACDAVSAPPRNCDVYTVGEALRKYGFPTKTKPWGEKEWLDFCEWLVSEVEA